MMMTHSMIARGLAVFLGGPLTLVWAAEAPTPPLGYAVTHEVPAYPVGPRIPLRDREAAREDGGRLTAFTPPWPAPDSGDGGRDDTAFAFGPVVQIDDRFSLYTLVGAAFAPRALPGADTAPAGMTGAAGMLFTPGGEWIIGTGYEVDTLHHDRYGTWMLGAGYRF